MLFGTSPRAGKVVALILVTVAAACRDASTPIEPGAFRPRPRPLPTLATARVRDSVPDGTAVGTLATANAPRTRYRAEYHNGMVKTGTSNVYFIWYGNWSRSWGATQQLLGELVATLGGTAYWRIATLYPDGNGARPGGGLVYSGEAFDSVYSQGAELTPDDVGDVVAQTILRGALPLDNYGIYIVLASADVSSPGYATAFCAFHQQLNIVGARVPFAFVVDPTRAPTACAPQMLGPNGTLGADAMASLLVAELFDSVTDGYFTGYYDRLGFEPASKCAWTYGTTYTAPNGAKANVNVGGHHLLLQQLWVPSKSGGACGMHQ